MESKILGEAQGGGGGVGGIEEQRIRFVVSGIGKIIRRQGKKTLMAFLDFKKAFPGVWRESLWERWNIMGVTESFEDRVTICREM